MDENVSARTAWTLADALRDLVSTKNDTSVDGVGTVSHIAQDGTIWVKLVGSNEKTPVNGTVISDVSPGDVVRVTVTNGRLSITGNATSPSVGQTQVNKTVEPVAEKANAAIDEARRAGEAANLAEAEALRAHDAADAAQTSANNAASAASSAQSSATQANTAANNAFTQLSTVQDVVGIVEWAAAHSEQDMATYISSHLALTNAGLYITLDDEGYKLLVAATGISVVDPQGHIVTNLGEVIRLDSSRPQYIGGEDAYIIYWDSDNDGIPDSIRIGGSNVEIGGGNLSDVLAEIAATTAATQALSQQLGTTEAPYREVEWVDTTGRQAVLLDWKPGVAGAFGFDADFIIWNTGFNTGAWCAITDPYATGIARGSCLFGIQQATDIRNVSVSHASYYLTTLTYFGSGGSLSTGGKTTNALLYKDQRRQQCSLRNGLYTAPDGTVVDLEQSEYGLGNSNMYLFGMRRMAGTSSPTAPTTAYVRLYSLKFYDDDVLAVDLIPVERVSDGMPGLYDRVAEKFWALPLAAVGETVGSCGVARSVIDDALWKNPQMQDLRDRASRLIRVRSEVIDKLEDGQEITVTTKYATATETFEAAGITNTQFNPASSNAMYLRFEYPDGTIDEAPVYYSVANGVTSHYGGGVVLHLTYHTSVTFNNATLALKGWWADANYDSNTNDNARYVQWYNNIYAKAALRSASIICGDDAGYCEIGAGVSFNLVYPVLWRTAALKAGGSDYQYSWTLTYDRTLATCYPNVSGTKNQMLYLVGTVSGSTFTCASTYLTFTVPTTEDGLIYLPLGKLGNQSTGQNYLVFSTGTNPTLYMFRDGAFQPVSWAAASDAAHALQTAEDIPIVTLSSTNGTVFKRNVGVSTTIVATIFTPGGRIDNATDLAERFGVGAYLEWGWRDVVTDADHVLVSTDPRIGNDGFTLTINPEDVDSQAVITCSLNY